jgi:hypothetical protein
VSGTWYLQRGRSDPLGPFTTEEVLEGLSQGEIPGDALVREIAATAWLPFAAVPEFRDAIATSRSDVSPEHAERLAPKPGPAWRSKADRHLGQSAGEPAEERAPTRKVRPAARPPPTPPEPIAQASSLVGAFVAALGIVWAFVRLGALLTPPSGWIAVVDRFHMVRDASVAELGLAMLAYPLLFLGIYCARVRAPLGVPLVRSVARVICAGNVTIVVVTVARLQQSPRLSELASTVTLYSMVALVPLFLSACAASLLWLFPAPSDAVERPNETVLSGLVAAGFVALCVALLAAFGDVVQIAPDGATFVYTDTIGLRLFLEGRREGVAGVSKLDEGRLRGFWLEAPTRARFITDFSVPVTDGRSEVGREVELLDGPRAGARVYLPPEDARIR